MDEQTYNTTVVHREISQCPTYTKYKKKENVCLMPNAKCKNLVSKYYV